MLVDHVGCGSDINTFASAVIILPGESQGYLYNTGTATNCGDVDCTMVTDTYSCYTSITPSQVTPLSGFYNLCTT